MQKFDNWDDAGLNEVKNTRKYDWVEMCDGSIWTALRGKDFTCTVESFRATLYSYAKRHKLEVRVHTKHEMVRFKFSKSGDS